MTTVATILAVEDEPLLLMAYEDAILDAGHRAVVADDLEAGLGAARPDVSVAILDIRLRDAFVFPIARRLREMGIPFVFASGTSEDIPCGEFADVPLLRKPVAATAVVEAAISLIRHQDSCAA